MDMPLDSCRAELSSSEELLEDGEVSLESSILWSSEVDGRRPTGWDAAAPTWRCLCCCLPALGCEWVFAQRAALRSARTLLPLPPLGFSTLALAAPFPRADCASLGSQLIPALSNDATPLAWEHFLALARP